MLEEKKKINKPTIFLKSIIEVKTTKFNMDLWFRRNYCCYAKTAPYPQINQKNGSDSKMTILALKCCNERDLKI